MMKINGGNEVEYDSESSKSSIATPNSPNDATMVNTHGAHELAGDRKTKSNEGSSLLSSNAVDEAVCVEVIGKPDWKDGPSANEFSHIPQGSIPNKEDSIEFFISDSSNKKERLNDPERAIEPSGVESSIGAHSDGDSDIGDQTCARRMDQASEGAIVSHIEYKDGEGLVVEDLKLQIQKLTDDNRELQGRLFNASMSVAQWTNREAEARRRQQEIKDEARVRIIQAAQAFDQNRCLRLQIASLEENLEEISRESEQYETAWESLKDAYRHLGSVHWQTVEKCNNTTDMYAELETQTKQLAVDYEELKKECTDREKAAQQSGEHYSNIIKDLSNQMVIARKLHEESHSIKGVVARLEDELVADKNIIQAFQTKEATQLREYNKLAAIYNNRTLESKHSRETLNDSNISSREKFRKLAQEITKSDALVKSVEQMHVLCASKLAAATTSEEKSRTALRIMTETYASARKSFDDVIHINLGTEIERCKLMAKLQLARNQQRSIQVELLSERQKLQEERDKNDIYSPQFENRAGVLHLPGCGTTEPLHRCHLVLAHETLRLQEWKEEAQRKMAKLKDLVKSGEELGEQVQALEEMKEKENAQRKIAELKDLVKSGEELGEQVEALEEKKEKEEGDEDEDEGLVKVENPGSETPPLNVFQIV